MNTKTLANHYATLTAEERFRLIQNARGRDDSAEVDRLVNAAPRIHLSMPDHAPFVHAFHELTWLIYIELLEEAAYYQEMNTRWGAELKGSIACAKNGDEAGKARPRKRRRRGEPAAEEDAVEWPDWHLTGRIAYGIGFLFKVKLEGWALFCARLNIPPFALWEQMELSGLDRIKRALALAAGGFAYRDTAAMVCWVNEVRSPGEPEWTEADIMTAEQFAGGLDFSFREFTNLRGGT